MFVLNTLKRYSARRGGHDDADANDGMNGAISDRVYRH